MLFVEVALGFFSTFFFSPYWVCEVSEEGDDQVVTRSSHDPWWRQAGLCFLPTSETHENGNTPDQSRRLCQCDRNHVTISALVFWLHASIPVPFFVLLERRFVFFCATIAVCKCSYGSTSCRGHGATHFEFVAVSSSIARSCFGLSACLEFSVERLLLCDVWIHLQN